VVVTILITVHLDHILADGKYSGKGLTDARFWNRRVLFIVIVLLKRTLPLASNLSFEARSKAV
jgi:hypothetical protein